jgi:Protein of unknown function (DUF2384)
MKDRDIEAWFARGKLLAQQLDRGERPAESRIFTFEDPVERRAMQQLVEQRAALVGKAGKFDRFDAPEWVADWLSRPCPALGGDRPISWLDTPERRKRVTKIIASAVNGAYL